MFGARALRWAHRVILSALLALLLLPAVKRAASIPGVASIAIALAAGVALSIPYLRTRTWRWSTVYLTPALVILPGLLLYHSPVSALLWPERVPTAVHEKIGNPAPVVLIVFDEFPLASLLAADGTIDAGSYPNFAELARRGTWYRNATSVSDGTLTSVPAILDGRYPVRSALPNAGGHPNSLFTLLGGSYRMHVVENNTRVCPDPLCGSARAPFRSRFPSLVSDASVLWLYAVLPSDLSGPLPDITQAWAGFTNPPDKITMKMWDSYDDLTNWDDRLREFRQFSDSVESTGWPTLHFLHILLPHAPWEYLPSGQRYPGGAGRIRGLRGPNDRKEDPNRWVGDEWSAAQSYQRHLLQVGLVDRLVGRLLKRLQDQGLFERSLIVITADHGTCFRPGDSRRYLTATNRGDILSVPLFIKYPHQQAGGIDDRGAQTVDILPTIADVLKVAMPAWKLDGKSLVSTAGTSVKRAFSDSGDRVEFAAGLDTLLESVKFKMSVFGGSSEDAIYRLGDRQGWIGRAAAPAGESPVGYELDRGVYYTSVDTRAPMLVSSISGRLIRPAQSKDPQDPLELAIGVNGTIRAVTRSYSAAGTDAFLAMVPDTSLRAGRNEIGVYLVRNGSELARLAPPPEKPYQWGTRLVFGKGGNAAPYIGTGWSGPEDKLNWTDGHTATLYLPVKPPRSDLKLRASLRAFTHDGTEVQHIHVLVNRRQITEWRLTSDFQEFTAIVPRECLLKAGTAEITFDMPDATAPMSLGVNSDSRTLGLAASWLEFMPQEGES